MEDDKLLWRLLHFLFVQCQNKGTRDYVLSEFDECKNKFMQLIRQRYEGKDGIFGENAYEYSQDAIVGMMAFRGYMENLKEATLFMGETVIKDCVFLKDAWNDNAIQAAIESKKLETIKFMININGVNEKIMNDHQELYDVLQKLNTDFDETIGKYMINELNITKKTINEIKEYKDFDATQILTLL